jgi:hypothetical protein
LLRATVGKEKERFDGKLTRTQGQNHAQNEVKNANGIAKDIAKDIVNDITGDNGFLRFASCG